MSTEISSAQYSRMSQQLAAELNQSAEVLQKLKLQGDKADPAQLEAAMAQYEKNYEAFIGLDQNVSVKISGNVSREASTGLKLGNNLESAEKAALAAFKTGDSGKIAQAQLLLDQAKRAFQAFSEMMKGKNDILMSIIRKLGGN